MKRLHMALVAALMLVVAPAARAQATRRAAAKPHAAQGDSAAKERAATVSSQRKVWRVDTARARTPTRHALRHSVTPDSVTRSPHPAKKP